LTLQRQRSHKNMPHNWQSVRQSYIRFSMRFPIVFPGHRLNYWPVNCTKRTSNGNRNRSRNCSNAGRA